jgi:hypothetical protein
MIVFLIEGKQAEMRVREKKKITRIIKEKSVHNLNNPISSFLSLETWQFSKNTTSRFLHQ